MIMILIGYMQHLFHILGIVKLNAIKHKCMIDKNIQFKIRFYNINNQNGHQNLDSIDLC